MNRLQAVFDRAWAAPVFAVLASLLCIALVLGMRGLGLLQPLELIVYDAGLRLRPAAEADPRLVLVVETEEDLQRFGHPLSDRVLAQVITRLVTAGARVIGIDKYRDVPVAPGSAELDAVLSREASVVWIMKAPAEGDPGVPAPAALRGTGRTGFNDILVDADGNIRRALVRMDGAGDEILASFPLVVASRFLGNATVPVSDDPQSADRIRIGKTGLRLLDAWMGAMPGWMRPASSTCSTFAACRAGSGRSPWRN